MRQPPIGDKNKYEDQQRSDEWRAAMPAVDCSWMASLGTGSRRAVLRCSVHACEIHACVFCMAERAICVVFPGSMPLLDP
jgi:hypothetical protein